MPLFFLLLVSACSRGESPAAPRSEYMLGTFCRVDLFESGTAACYERLFARLAELEGILSAASSSSELAALNRSAGNRPLNVSPELFTVLERAQYFANASGGAFDPTVGPLVQLWGIGDESAGQIPSPEKINAALALVHWQDMELVSGRSGGTVFLTRRGMSLDLGGIAKGYAADELARIVREENIPRALIDLGGDIYVCGDKPDGTPWRIGVQDPLDDRGNYVGILELKRNMSAVTSGVYERYFIGDDGKRYHHILNVKETETNPMRGYPVENGLLSVTIIGPSSMDADALSTACFVLGYEQGRVLAEKSGAGALFIFEDKAVRGTSGALAAFTLTDKTYTVEVTNVQR